MLRLAYGHVWRASPEALLVQCNKVSKFYCISKCTTGSYSSIASRQKHLLHNRHAQPSGTWQSNCFECSTTSSRMTAGTIFETPILPSSPMPPLWAVNHNTLDKCHVRLYSTKPQGTPETDENHNETKTLSQPKDETSIQVEEKEEKLSLVQKFKLMYKQYWYVLIPVHVVTSIVWYGSFFLAAKSGVDIVPIMEKLGAGEKILSHLRTSDAGYYAIAYAMYKIATPARYTVTIGGTTISINYLKKHGYIKPVPSKEKLKEIYEGKKEEYKERRDEIKEKLQEKKEEIKERREEMKEKLQEKKEEMKERVQERKDEIYGRVQERREEIKEKLQDGKEKLDDMKKSIIRRRKED